MEDDKYLVTCQPIPSAILQDVLRPMGGLRKLVVTTRNQALREVITALMYLNDERPAIHDFHVLVNSRPGDDVLLAESIAWLREAKIPRIRIMIPEGCAVSHDLTLDTDGFESVSVLICRTMPTIALPPVCATESNMWSAWDTFLTPRYGIH